MSGPDVADSFRAGVWSDNPGLVQLLGLCPLLAVTTTFVNGLGLGLATLLVLSCSNVLVSATRRFIRPQIRIPMYVLIISSLVTCIELIFLAWFPSLGRSLGIFIPLIVTNCAIVARAEVFASRSGVVASLVDGLAMGIGFALEPDDLAARGNFASAAPDVGSGPVEMSFSTFFKSSMDLKDDFLATMTTCGSHVSLISQLNFRQSYFTPGEFSN